MLRPAQGAEARRSPPARLHRVVVTGTVTSLHKSTEEPGAALQATFHLRTPTQSILVSMPAIEFMCFKGARATLEGDLAPADDVFPPILLAAKLLSCE